MLKTQITRRFNPESDTDAILMNNLIEAFSTDKSEIEVIVQETGLEVVSIIIEDSELTDRMYETLAEVDARAVKC